MPIYEYYCPDNHTVYQFYAKTLAQGRTVPKCPDNPKFKLRKLVSSFAVTGGGRRDEAAGGGPAGDANPGDAAEDARMEAAMGAMEREFSSVEDRPGQLEMFSAGDERRRRLAAVVDSLKKKSGGESVAFGHQLGSTEKLERSFSRARLSRDARRNS